MMRPAGLDRLRAAAADLERLRNVAAAEESEKKDESKEPPAPKPTLPGASRWKKVADAHTAGKLQTATAPPGSTSASGSAGPTAGSGLASLTARMMQRFASKGRRQSGSGDDMFIPEARRRFVFDDTALRTGGKYKDVFASEEPPEENFDDIVDQDETRVQEFVSEELVGRFIDTIYFRIFIFGLIVVNSILIGLQTDETLSVTYRFLFSIFDQLVMATFICEILLKWYYGFWIFWKAGWNVLDFVIIMALILGPQLSFLSSSRILRILRVLRAFRSLRSIGSLAGLSMVVQTILQSVPDMANIVLLLCIIVVVLGVVGVTLFGEIIPEHFGDLASAMYALFICVTQDGWVQIFEKFREKDLSLHIGGMMYFFLSIMIGAFVFANLVVAVVVTNLEMAMREMKEEKKAQVDTLATTTPATENDDFLAPENPQTVPVLGYEEHVTNFDITTQAPLQLQDLKGVSIDRLEKYFLLLVALEENLTEYMQIRSDMEVVYDVISDLNVQYLDGEAGSSANVVNEPQPNININDLKKGDILSNLMKLEDSNRVSSRNKQDLSDVIRSLPSKK